jgi:hypothetical protein
MLVCVIASGESISRHVHVTLQRACVCAYVRVCVCVCVCVCVAGMNIAYATDVALRTVREWYATRRARHEQAVHVGFSFAFIAYRIDT